VSLVRSVADTENIEEDVVTDNEEEIQQKKTNSDSSPRLSTLQSFNCIDPRCVKRFIRHANLLAHLSTGNHVFEREEKFSLKDTSMLTFAQRLQADRFHPAHALQNFVPQQSNRETTLSKYNLDEGWALAKAKPKVAFTKSQKDFLLKKYELGERNKASKMSGTAAAEVSDSASQII
jgi:hypothetical protein